MPHDGLGGLCLGGAMEVGVRVVVTACSFGFGQVAPRNHPQLASGGLPCDRNTWEVHVGTGDVIEVVGENVHRDIGNDLRDFAIGIACGPHASNRIVGDFTLFDNESLRELEARIALGLLLLRLARAGQSLHWSA